MILILNHLLWEALQDYEVIWVTTSCNPVSVLYVHSVLFLAVKLKLFKVDVRLCQGT